MQGRRLDGMIRNGENIEKQSKDPQNKWYWLKDETPKITAAIALVGPVNTVSQQYVVTSQFRVLQKSFPTEVAATVWLDKHKTEVKNAIDLLQVPLGDVTSVHQTKLRNEAKDTMQLATKPKKSRKRSSE